MEGYQPELIEHGQFVNLLDWTSQINIYSVGGRDVRALVHRISVEQFIKSGPNTITI